MMKLTRNIILNKVIRLTLKFIEEKRELIDWQDFDPNFLVAETIIGFLEKTISIFKYPSFRDEKEYRMEYEFDGNINKNIDEKLDFRASDNLIVPYIKLTTQYQDFLKEKKEDFINDSTSLLKRIPIDNVIVGQSLEFPSLKKSIQKLLITNGYEDIEILESKVPYRI